MNSDAIPVEPPPTHLVETDQSLPTHSVEMDHHLPTYSIETNQPLTLSRNRLPKCKAAENHLLNQLKIVEEEEKEEEAEEEEEQEEEQDYMIEDEDDFYELEEVLDGVEYGPGPLSSVSDLDPKSAIQRKAVVPPIAKTKAKGKRGRQAVQSPKARKRAARQRDEKPESNHVDDEESDSGSISGKHTDSDNCLTQIWYRSANFRIRGDYSQ
jgi:hypothetical protein